MKIEVKRVYQVEDPSDGYRVLVDKLWPRGIKKADLHYDLWAKQIVPSDALRKFFHEDIVGHWDIFKDKYIEELRNSDDFNEFVEQLKMKKPAVLTLLYASKEPIHNHALILKDEINRALNKEQL